MVAIRRRMAELPSAAWLADVTRFDPPKHIDAPPDWDEAVQVLAHHGLAPIAAYNLNYRMPETDCPDFAKEMLLGFFQGISSDNVFKFVMLKNLVGSLGVQVAMLDGAAFAENLYPHIAFRPVPELKLLVPREDVPMIMEAMREERFVDVEPDEPDPEAPAVTLFNERFYTKLFTSILPNEKAMPGLFERAVAAKAYGASVTRLAAEDALVVHALTLARHGFAVPLVQLIDLREMVKGESPMAFRGGPGAAIDPKVVKERAKAFGAERALWAALEILVHYHPEVEDQARAMQPDLSFASRKLLETAVVVPAYDYMRDRQLKAVGKLQQLLLG